MKRLEDKNKGNIIFENVTRQNFSHALTFFFVSPLSLDLLLCTLFALWRRRASRKKKTARRKKNVRMDVKVLFIFIILEF